MGIKKFIAIFVLIAVLLMPVAVFADVPMPDPPLGAYQYWTVIQKSDGYVYFYSSPKPIKVTQDPNNNYKLFFYNVRWYVYSDGGWSYENEMLGQVESYFENMYASNHDIEYKDGSGFFFTPPKVSTLSQIVRKAKSQGVFGMIWKIILDGLIPLVGLLILGISLRKGWAFLRNQLMH